jgi:hypothetical protein
LFDILIKVLGDVINYDVRRSSLRWRRWWKDSIEEANASTGALAGSLPDDSHLTEREIDFK